MSWQGLTDICIYGWIHLYLALLFLHSRGTSISDQGFSGMRATSRVNIRSIIVVIEWHHPNTKFQLPLGVTCFALGCINVCVFCVLWEQQPATGHHSCCFCDCGINPIRIKSLKWMWRCQLTSPQKSRTIALYSGISGWEVVYHHLWIPDHTINRTPDVTLSRFRVASSCKMYLHTYPLWYEWELLFDTLIITQTLWVDY